ncbi:MAG: tetratricopeptide repeat protein [Acidobacteriota bacterium]
MSAREVLDLGAAQVRAELGDQPELRADLLEHLASIYLSLGLYDRVERLVEEVETLRRGRLGQAHPKMPQVLHLRGRWMQATDRFEDAEAVHREALDLRRRALGPESPEVADSLAHLADLAYTRGAFEAAAVLARQSLLMRRSTAPEDRTGLAIGLNDLGATLARTDQRRDAEPLLREALDLRLQQFGEIHPSVAESLGTLGHLLWGLGQQGEAEELYRRALDVRRRLYGEEHPQVARSLNNLGNRLRVADRTTEAEVLLREAVTIFRAQRRAHRDDLRRALGNLAEVLRLRDRPAEALPAYREALELTLDIAGPDDPGADTLRWKIGDCLLASGDVDGAEGVYRGVLDRRTERYPEEHRRVAGPRVFVARALLARDSPRPRDLREAESLLRAAHPVLARKAPGHWLTGEAAVLLGDCRARAGRRSEARALLRSGLGILDATDGGSLAPVALERLRDLAEGQLAALGDPDSTLKGPDPSTATR